jgi:cell division protein ZapA (FtsZ GTPase activity inhibitor)
MANKVKVRIFGQEYNVSGDKDPEEIQKIAEYVDSRRRLIAKMTEKSSNSVVQALTCLNIADEYFDAMDKMERMRTEMESIQSGTKDHETQIAEARKEVEKMKAEVKRAEKDREELSQQYKELEKQCAEFENSVFDLQMENIQLKSELEKLNNDG